MVITRDPDKGTRNVGCYRMQGYDKRTAGMHWQLHKTGRRHMRRYKELGIQRMPVAVALGGDPLLPYAATAALTAPATSTSRPPAPPRRATS
jgi:4-hydroxy-3-polyprenylbenzoate decarboxylase